MKRFVSGSRTGRVRGGGRVVAGGFRGSVREGGGGFVGVGVVVGAEGVDARRRCALGEHGERERVVAREAICFRRELDGKRSGSAEAEGVPR